MKFLICNDDGYEGRGLHILVKALAKYGECYVVVPDRERSCSSMSTNLHDDIFIEEVQIEGAVKAYKCTGLPTDCCKVGLELYKDVDIVFSGINSGNNMGSDILYSGTVGAVTEALLAHYKNVAISTDYKNFEMAEREIDDILKYILVDHFDLIHEDYVLNINFPSKVYEKSKGIKVAYMGRRLFKYYYEFDENNPGKLTPKSYLVESGSDEGSDCYYHGLGYTTIAPIGLDRTNYKVYNEMLERCKK